MIVCQANCLVDMIVQQIIPAVEECEKGPLFDLEAAVANVKRDLQAIHQVRASIGIGCALF